MAKASLFRKTALDRLSSPEQLDQLLIVTRPRSWVALAGVWFMVAVTLAWSVFGRLPMTIGGSGILLSAAGLRPVEAMATGVVRSLAVAEGDLVEVGALIAEIRQPRLEQLRAQAEDRLRLLRTEREIRRGFLGSNRSLETERLAREQRDLQRRRAALQERIAYLEQRVAAEREARGLGLVTEASVQASVQDLDAGRSELAGRDLELQNLELQRLLLTNRATESLQQIDERIREAERDLAARTLEVTEASRVTSPYRGYVSEIRSNAGQMATAGQAIVSIELADVPLQALVFVTAEGKRIEPGMDARISPVTVRQEEYGYMVGVVRAVSTQPVTRAGLERTLGNDILVQQLAAGGAPFLVEVTLTADSATQSGFRWSSRKGPPMRVGSGTSIAVDVVVARRRPITLLLPMLRTAFGAGG